MEVQRYEWDTLLGSAYISREEHPLHHIKAPGEEGERKSLCKRVRPSSWTEYADKLPAPADRCPTCVAKALKLGLDIETLFVVGRDGW